MEIQKILIYKSLGSLCVAALLVALLLFLTRTYAYDPYYIVTICLFGIMLFLAASIMYALDWISNRFGKNMGKYVFFALPLAFFIKYVFFLQNIFNPLIYYLKFLGFFGGFIIVYHILKKYMSRESRLISVGVSFLYLAYFLFLALLQLYVGGFNSFQ